jgi:1-acyl-sn-glycerol-3-phosphate acyltransferase
VLLRSLVFNGVFYLNFLVQAVLFSPVLLLPERMFWPIGRFWVASSLGLHRVICGVDDAVRGRDNIPQGGFIVASKHQSAWETLRLVELFPRPSFILKRQLLWIPLFGWYMWKAGMIPVDRGKGAEAIAAMTLRARRAIAEGRQIIIFPEGTRRPPLAPPQYRHGVARLYHDLGVACLPVALNSGLFWPRRSMVHHPGTILVEILPPIAAGREPAEFATELQTAIESATNRLISESIRRDGIVLEAGND